MTQPIGFAPDTAMLQMQQAALGRAQSASAAGTSNADMPAIRKAASEFEAVFASEMLSHMFSGVGTGGPFGGGHGEEMFRSLLVDQYGKALGRSGTLGIADQVAAQLIKAQEH
jgi:Rod binding domain-containing protein